MSMDRWVKYLDEDDREQEFLLPRTLPLSEVEILGKQNRHLLISGESGTGRSALALLIWNKSPRFDTRFTSTDANGKRLLHIVNCTHRKDELVTSELFGTEKVAHTGDTRDRPGILRILAGGTLVAKELGHLGGDVQTKLLRFLNDGKLLKLGSDYLEERVDVRVIATNTADANSLENVRVDLAAAFLQPITTLPPLRERIDDIPTLIAKFMEPDEYYLGISIDWLVGMMKAEWKGNIQDLKNYCEAMTGRGSTLTQEVISGKKTLDPKDRIICRNTSPHTFKQWQFDNQPFLYLSQNIDASHITYYHIVNNLLQNLLATGSDLLERARACASLRNSLIILYRMALMHCSGASSVYVLFSSIRKGSITCRRFIICDVGFCLSSEECSLGEFIADIFKWAHEIRNLPDSEDDCRDFKMTIFDSPAVSETFAELEASLPCLDGPIPLEITAKVVSPTTPVQSRDPKLNPSRRKGTSSNLSMTTQPSDMHVMTGEQGSAYKLILKGFDPKKEKFLLTVNSKHCEIAESQMMKIFAFAVAKICAKGKEFPGLRRDLQSSLGYKLYDALGVKSFTKIIIEARKGLNGLDIEAHVNVKGFKQGLIEARKPDDAIKDDTGTYPDAFQLSWDRDNIDVTLLVDFISQPHAPVSPKFKDLLKIYRSRS